MERKYPSRPIAAVGLLILDGERIVLVRRDKAPLEGWWTFPGGAIELGETLEETARREALEETGLDINVRGIADAVDHVDRDEDGRVCYHYLIVDLLARPVGGSLQAGSDASDARWVRLEELDTMQVTEKAAAMARAFLRGGQRPGIEGAKKPSSDRS